MKMMSQAWEGREGVNTVWYLISGMSSCINRRAEEVLWLCGGSSMFQQPDVCWCFCSGWPGEPRQFYLKIQPGGFLFYHQLQPSKGCLFAQTPFSRPPHRKTTELRNSRSELKSSIKMISWMRDGGLRIRTLSGRDEWGHRTEKCINSSKREVVLPFDGPEKSGASLIVECDDDAGGRKVGVIAYRCTPEK